MTEAELAKAITEIQFSLADLSEKVDFLRAHTEENRKVWENLQDLGKDLALIGQSAFDSTLKDLEDLDPNVTIEDSFRLLRRTAENSRNIEWALLNLESFRDFLSDVGPIATDIIHTLTQFLDALDKRGVFKLFIEFWRIADAFLHTVDESDLKKLGEAMSELRPMLHEVDPSAVIRLIRRMAIALRIKETPTAREITGIWSIMRKMKEPEVQRGVESIFEIIKAIPEPQVHSEPKKLA